MSVKYNILSDQEEILLFGKESTILTIYNMRVALNRGPQQKPALYLYCILITEMGINKRIDESIKNSLQILNNNSKE